MRARPAGTCIPDRAAVSARIASLCFWQRRDNGYPGWGEKQTLPKLQARSASGQQRTSPRMRLRASLHWRTLHIGADDELTTIKFSQVSDCLVDVEQAEMTDDELSNTRLLRNASHDGRGCM